jgi:hypothetical protein
VLQDMSVLRQDAMHGSTEDELGAHLVGEHANLSGDDRLRAIEGARKCWAYRRDAS